MLHPVFVIIFVQQELYQAPLANLLSISEVLFERQINNGAFTDPRIFTATRAIDLM